MSRTAHSGSAPSRGRRRIAILLAILLLVALPLYLWPFRSGVQGLPGAAAPSGAPRDPRSAAAIAQLSTDVWDGLMGHRTERGRTHREAPRRPGNLTRISPLEDGADPAALGGSGGGGAVMVDLPGAGPISVAMLADAGTAPGGGLPESGAGPSSSAGGDEQTGNAPNGGYWPFSGVGPFGGGGGPGGTAAPPTFVSGPAPIDSPMPTPEPSTLMLVGSNLTLAGAVAWRYVRKRQERKPSG
ncbi:MAG TPA: PEP-CTERM sorting domain-containing protein [Methylomirabilota bacterium]|nr:PEP-CTERM sorting domain-containing protein [Methylomirabilota bacterium]